MVNRAIRASKTKSNKKIIELDEIDYLHNKLQDYIRNMPINKNNFCLVLVKAMEIIENYKDSDVKNKKITVEKALQRLIMIDLDLSDFDQKFILASIPNLIDIIILCSKSRTHTNEKRNFSDQNHNIDETILANNGQIIFSLIDKTSTIIIKKQYNADRLFVNIGTLLYLMMILVDKFQYLTGCEKKNIVIESFNLLIKNKLEYLIDLPKDKKRDILETIEVIPLLIDLFITLQKGRYRINRKQYNKKLHHANTGWFNKLFGSKK
jgi:hypothetical protein